MNAATFPKVTVAFLSWNRLHYLRATVASARECIRYPNLEWIVSDNASDEPGVREYVDSLNWMDHRLIKRQTHAEAMNELVRVATGEYLILWPDDMQFVVRGEWLADIVEILDAHPSIGSVGLDFLRHVTLETLYTPRWWPNRGRLLDEVRRYGLNFRRPRTLQSSRGFTLRTTGWTWRGICASGIPSLTRTQVWRDLGPWRVKTAGASSVVDSSLGAEDDMLLRFNESRRPLQSAFLMLSVAADIITDPTGCKAKCRGRYRYGVYMPPPSGPYYYRIRDQADFAGHAGPLPISFTEGVQAEGFRIPMDARGDRLKHSINLSVVHDMQRRVDVPWPLTLDP